MKIRRILLLILASLCMASSQAIIIRHDVGPANYEVRNSEYPAVFFLERQGGRKTCVATVIHRQWALTAAHCLQETLLGNSIENGMRYAVEVGNRAREIDAAIVHPDYDINSNSDVDLALLRFREASATPSPMPVQLDEIQRGEIVTMLGWGYFGLGTTGRQYNDGSLRQATNRITEVGRRLRVLFDDPRDRDSLALPLEGMPGLGDSGGPAFLDSEAGLVLAGIIVGEVEGEGFSEENQGQYGSIAVLESVSRHLDWMAAVIGTAPPFDS